MNINVFKRYQVGLNIVDLYPNTNDGKCACGCGNKLIGRKKRWFSDDCLSKSLNNFFIIKGDITVIRKNLFEIDYGYCRKCGVLSDNWEADHIIPVFKGGGGCFLDNFQTLCKHCHFEKSLLDKKTI